MAFCEEEGFYEVGLGYVDSSLERGGMIVQFSILRST